MRVVKSIHPVQNSNVIPTGTLPIRVFADDFEVYLCKHTNQLRANILFNELVAAEFIQFWGLEMPEHVFITIPQRHISNEILEPRITYKNFERKCFGLKYLQFAQDSNEFIMGAKRNSNFANRIINKDDLIKIALFDIWIGNEDRTANNHNLLINPEKNGYRIIPIDHESIFNTSGPEQRVFEITMEDSIVFSDIFATLITKQKTKTFVKKLDAIIEDFKEHVKLCKNHKESLLDKVPQDWNILLSDKVMLLDYIFSPQWVDKSINLLKQFITEHQKTKS